MILPARPSPIHANLWPEHKDTLEEERQKEREGFDRPQSSKA